MKHDPLYLRARQFLLNEIKLLTQSCHSASLLDLPGVTASVVPVTPNRSRFNWVVYEQPAALVRYYGTLARAYEDAGIRAWTVWVDPDSQATAEFLADRGHHLDSSPIAMAAPMSELRLPDPADLDWDTTDDFGLLAEINDKAWGFPPPAFNAVLNRSDLPDWTGYIARLNRKVVAGLLLYLDHRGDCGVTAVATLPEARGHRIASRLLTVALRQARQKGALTTALQASPMGTRLYAALGFRDLGTMGMWEKRKPFNMDLSMFQTGRHAIMDQS